MNRAQEPGWVRIGRWDSQERRSLWVRLTWRSAHADVPERIELCAGREGDDALWIVDDKDPCFASLWDIIETQLFAVET